MYELDQPRFLNAVVEAQTELSPEALLDAVKEIERQLGRKPRSRNGPREIDIDILMYGAKQLDSPELTLPHPRMQERPFVLVPLMELTGDRCSSSGDLMMVEGPEWALG